MKKIIELTAIVKEINDKKRNALESWKENRRKTDGTVPSRLFFKRTSDIGKDDLELLDQDISKFHEINLRSTVDETQKSEISSCDVLSMPNDEIFPEKEEITLTYIVASSKFSGKN